MEEKVIFSGSGGQGVLMAGLMLSYAAVEEGKNTSFFPSYGAEMRGGTANSSVIVSDDEIASPVVFHPTILVAFNQPSIDKFMPRVESGGVVIYNEGLVKKLPDRSDLKIFKIPAEEIALELGNSRVMNSVLVGALAKITGLVKKESLFTALRKILTGKKSAFIPLNEEAIERGYELV